MSRRSLMTSGAALVVKHVYVPPQSDRQTNRDNQSSGFSNLTNRDDQSSGLPNLTDRYNQSSGLHNLTNREKQSTFRPLQSDKHTDRDNQSSGLSNLTNRQTETINLQASPI